MTVFLAALLVASTLSAPRVAVGASLEETLLSASRQANVGIAPPPCQDGAYNLIGAKWTTTYSWHFKASSTPAGLISNAVQVILAKSFDNITKANNDCGLADDIGATHEYAGETTKSPDCGSRDGVNVVGFAKLQAGVLAVTCYWMSSGHMVEADMKINNQESWALTTLGCTGNKPLLESTATHEAGHVFGLAHVGERRHGRLTMSPYIDGNCEDNEATLGKGDVRGLRQLY
jgi:hypothetical protein